MKIEIKTRMEESRRRSSPGRVLVDRCHSDQAQKPHPCVLQSLPLGSPKTDVKDCLPSLLFSSIT